MARTKKPPFKMDLDRLREVVGEDEFFRQVGAKEFLNQLGIDGIIAQLTPKQRQELLRRLQESRPGTP